MTTDRANRTVPLRARMKTTRIMRRIPGVWLVAHDHPRRGKVGAHTYYTVRIRRRDGVWYHNYNTRYFAWALECWKKEREEKRARRSMI